MKITLEQVRLFGACSRSVALFEATFGTEVEITEAVCIENGSKFDINWLAKKLFSGGLLEEYLDKCPPIWDEYVIDSALLWEEYFAKRSLVFMECVKKMEMGK